MTLEFLYTISELILLSKEEKSQHGPPSKVGQARTHSSTETGQAHRVFLVFISLGRECFIDSILVYWELGVYRKNYDNREGQVEFLKVQSLRGSKKIILWGW